MYKLILSVNNLEEVMVWPSVPPDFGPEQSQRNGTYEGLSGDFNTLGPMKLWSIPMEGVFPVGNRRPYMPAEAEEDGWRYVDFLNRNMARRIPFRITLLDNSGVCRFNDACSVDNFSWKVKRNGDISYSLTFREYRFITGSGVI